MESLCHRPVCARERNRSRIFGGGRTRSAAIDNDVWESIIVKAAAAATVSIDLLFPVFFGVINHIVSIIESASNTTIFGIGVVTYKHPVSTVIGIPDRHHQHLLHRRQEGQVLRRQRSSTSSTVLRRRGRFSLPPPQVNNGNGRN